MRSLKPPLPHGLSAKIPGPEGHVTGADRQQHERDSQCRHHRLVRQQTVNKTQAGWHAAGIQEWTSWWHAIFRSR